MKTRIIALAHLRIAASNRPGGYFDDVVSRGKIEGGVLILDENVYFALCRKYKSRPKVIRNAMRAAGRLASAIINGSKIRVSGRERDRRFAICQSCEYFDGRKCKLCGCYAKLKVRLETEHCPINKW